MRVEAGQVAVKLEEDVLGQVFGVAGRAGKPVADGVNAPVLRDDKLLPGLLVARHALADQLAECLLRGFLFGRALQSRLMPWPPGCLLRVPRRGVHRGVGRWQKCTALRSRMTRFVQYGVPSSRANRRAALRPRGAGHKPRRRHRHVQNAHTCYTRRPAHWFNRVVSGIDR